MVRIGGYFTQVSNANNFMGFGLWQISPELIFRVFTPLNGFDVIAVLLHEVVPKGSWYLVLDPAEQQKPWWQLRVELCNKVPTYILTIAKRISMENIFAVAPQQLDYVVRRQGASPPASPHRSFAAIRRLVPSNVRTSIRKVQAALKKSSPFDRPYYRQLSEDEVILGRFLKN